MIRLFYSFFQFTMCLPSKIIQPIFYAPRMLSTKYHNTHTFDLTCVISKTRVMCQNSLRLNSNVFMSKTKNHTHFQRHRTTKYSTNQTLKPHTKNQKLTQNTPISHSPTHKTSHNTTST